MLLMAKIIFEQTEQMWINQLDQDKDVIAQLDAITHLAQFNSKDTLRALSKALLSNDYFYRGMLMCYFFLDLIFPNSNNF